MGRCKRDETRCDIEIATLRNELEKAKAALAAADHLCSVTVLSEEQAVQGARHAYRALRDASDAEVAAATDSIMDNNETLYTRLAARSDEDKP